MIVVPFETRRIDFLFSFFRIHDACGRERSENAILLCDARDSLSLSLSLSLISSRRIHEVENQGCHISNAAKRANIDGEKGHVNIHISTVDATLDDCHSLSAISFKHFPNPSSQLSVCIRFILSSFLFSRI